MKRELYDIKRVTVCCPGHDNYPCQTYNSNRSKKARSKGKAMEHRYVRRLKKQNLLKEIRE